MYSWLLSDPPPESDTPATIDGYERCMRSGRDGVFLFRDANHFTEPVPCIVAEYLIRGLEALDAARNQAPA